MNAQNERAVLVGGDFVVDHHIYEGRRLHYGDGKSPGVHVWEEEGGAALIHKVLLELLAPGWKSYCTVKKPRKVSTAQEDYAFWRPFPGNKPEEKQYWRVSEAMGFGATEGQLPSAQWPAADVLPPRPEIIVLSEGGMGFRDNRDCWKDLDFGAARALVLKTAAPVGRGKLWQELTSNPEYAHKLVVVVSARDLRKLEAQISVGLSWEATVQSLLCELRPGKMLESLRHCRHLLVAFESEGGIWIDFGKEPAHGGGTVDHARAHFVYDAACIEGDHASDAKGTAFGFLSCLAAAAVWQLTLDADSPNLTAALDGGLSAMRDLRERGHGPVPERGSGFPAARLANAIKHPEHSYCRAVFPCSRPLRGCGAVSGNDATGWSLVVESQRDVGPAYDLGRLVLQRGPIALASLPHLRVEHLVAVDRGEIESLRTLTQLIRQYKDHDPGKMPLSIGIFGPPGAGKSFAVSELAAKLVGKDTWLEFNLSQFNTPDDLIGACHQIRDRVLQKQLPVAFFDEFDSQHYKWLQYLLAPMQDGKFQEGPLTHTLGKCIFVFAGATSYTFETFGPPETEADGSPEEVKASLDFVLAKGPDFKSRLDGYLDVVGPNPRMVVAPDQGVGKPARSPQTAPSGARMVCGRLFLPDPGDLCFPIRRALMIRAKLRCAPDEKLDIDPGVVHALLRVSAFEHGARSLDKILQPFQPVRPGPLFRSLLPPRGQLAMQTDAEQLLRLCGEPKQCEDAVGLSDEHVEIVATAIHQTYRELGRREGWIKQAMDVDFEDLPASFAKSRRKCRKQLGVFYQESNREAARRIPAILGLVGLRLAAGSFSTAEEDKVREHIEYHLELLADAEHERWMEWHLAQGWRYAVQKDADNRVHDCLLPFSQLSQAQRNKDRTTIREYVNLAKKVGMKITFCTS